MIVVVIIIIGLMQLTRLRQVLCPAVIVMITSLIVTVILVVIIRIFII